MGHFDAVLIKLGALWTGEGCAVFSMTECVIVGWIMFAEACLAGVYICSVTQLKKTICLELKQWGHHG